MEQHALVLNKHHSAVTHATAIFWAWNDFGDFAYPYLVAEVCVSSSIVIMWSVWKLIPPCKFSSYSVLW